MPALVSTVRLHLVYAPQPIGDSVIPGKDPLIVAQFVQYDNEARKLALYDVYGAPRDLQPGHYDVAIETRPKKDKPGLNYWFKSAVKAEK